MFRGVIFNCDKLVRRGPGGARRWLEVGPGAPSAVLVYDPRFLDHVASPLHVERPDRLRSIVSNLEAAGLFTDIEQAPPATRPDLKRVHRDSYLESFENLGEGLLDPETAVHPGTFDLALLAAGAVLHGTRSAARTGRPTVSLVRPPGHHAGPTTEGASAISTTSRSRRRIRSRRDGGLRSWITMRTTGTGRATSLPESHPSCTCRPTGMGFSRARVPPKTSGRARAADAPSTSRFPRGAGTPRTSRPTNASSNRSSSSSDRTWCS